MNKEMRIIVEEVARIALEDHDLRDYIGHELNLNDEELEKAYRLLESKLNS